MKKILVIEDEALLRESLIDVLHFEDFQVFGADNGWSGLEVVRAEMPDLVLCDISMPGLDGYGVLNALQNDPVTSTIPVILLTAKVGRDAVQYGLGLGAVAYVTKPFTINGLLDTIHSHLS